MLVSNSLGLYPSTQGPGVNLPCLSLSFPISNPIVMTRVTLQAVLTQTMGLIGERCVHQ